MPRRISPRRETPRETADREIKRAAELLDKLRAEESLGTLYKLWNIISQYLAWSGSSPDNLVAAVADAVDPFDPIDWRG